MSPRTSHIPAKSRKSVHLNPNLDKKLVAYAACATGLLALPQSTEAKIVFTSAHTVITSSVALDVNGDGINDFFFQNSGFPIRTGTSFYSQYVNVDGAQASNQVIGYLNFGREASALSAGVTVDSKGQFISYFPAGLANCAVGSFGSSKGGKWFGVRNKFLGFKFVINGQTHYGWARLSVRNTGRCNLGALLTGYAYETVAGKPILTGQRSGTADQIGFLNPEVSPAQSAYSSVLGLLAQGTVGLEIWRREEPAIGN